MGKELKIALIGCGQISEAHLSEIAHIPDARVAAVCDLIGHLAEDTAERYDIPRWYTNFKEMISEERPDAVHLTTPPHTHMDIGSYVIDNGCHLYIEKPFCTSARETVALIERAKENHVIICAGFSELGDDVSVKFRAFAGAGRLGDVVHIESYYGSSMDGNFSKVFLQTDDHWIHRLPGKLFQNIISHALYHVTPLFPGTVEEVMCFAEDRSGNGVFQDELRVIAKSGHVTAYVTFTSAVRPVTQFVRIYGTKAIAELDFTNHIFKTHEQTTLPGPIARLRNAFVPAFELFKEGISNAKKFIFGQDRFFSGMGRVIDGFYKAIREGSGEPPIPYKDVINTAILLDEIVRTNREKQGPEVEGGQIEGVVS